MRDIHKWPKTCRGDLVLDSMKLHKRFVKVSPLPEGATIHCSDCNRNAKYLIVEPSGYILYWCGDC